MTLRLRGAPPNVAFFFRRFPPPFQVPASCCRVDPVTGVAANCTEANPAHEDQLWTKDCFSEGLAFVKGHAVYLFAVALVIALVMVRGDFLSFS